jgi:hypothetical protein
VTATCRLTGRVTVPLPPDRAFRLFTPVGERDWVPGWEPHFPADADHADAGGADDNSPDAAPGTVFETHGHDEHERTIWVVVDSVPGRRIAYARVTPHGSAGTVTVTLDDAGGQSEVTVTYALTALTEAADGDLHAFREGYAAYLASWQDAIAAALTAERSDGGPGTARGRPTTVPVG